MTKQELHKVVTVMVVLSVFLLPFYLQKDQFGSLDGSAYMLGASVRGSQTANLPAEQVVQANHAAAAASIAGTSFIGVQAKP